MLALYDILKIIAGYICFIRITSSDGCGPVLKIAQAVELDLGEGLIGDDRTDGAFGGHRGQLDADGKDRSDHDQADGHNAGGDQHLSQRESRLFTVSVHDTPSLTRPCTG